MNVVLSPHARERMELRNITEDMVRETLKHPEKTETSFRRRTIVYRRFQEGIIKVPFVTEGDIQHVITVIWESRI